ncbi:MAG: S49 family peptidase, partial [Pseudomonadota bacterium]
LQSVIEGGYEAFLSLVGEHRDMSRDEVDAVAQGRVWTGAQAQERGLVDQLGTLQQATAAAARIAGLGDEFTTVYIEAKLSPFEEFLAGMGGQALAHVGLTLKPPSWAQFMGQDLYLSMLQQLNQIAQGSPSNRPMPDVMAHCLCEPPR